MHADIAALKATLRAQARERRAVAYRATGASIAAKLRDYLPELYLPSRCIVAGYVQRGSELDPLPALKLLHDRGYRLALPAVVAKDAPLIFRTWAPGDALAPDAAGLPAPLPAAAETVPEALFVPLVAFDGKGHRIGTGAGYYDRTLPGLRAQNPKLIAIGLAFAVQQERELPHEPTDAPLDAVITERGVLWFRERAG
ncbi:MAG: 5-formyltetrahydrofolate cyclo-ligase [Alphaproteobacteria bacterium]|nr:5-formyltetrahydrofolate cyclo-ligase [Alphaproteobacteria bacterium]